MNATDRTTPTLLNDLDKLEQELHRLSSQMCEAQWDFYTGSEETKLDDLVSQSRAFYTNADAISLIKSLSDNHPEIDHINRRRISILQREFMREQVRCRNDIATKVHSAIAQLNSSRAEFEGEIVGNSRIDEVIETCPDRVRRQKAWTARARLGRPIAPIVQELVTLRNTQSKELGFSDFRALICATQELNESKLDALLTQVEQATDPLWNIVLEKKKRVLNVERLGPWDLPFCANSWGETLRKLFPKKNMMDTLGRTFEGLGMPLGSLPLALDIEARDGKSEHAYCFPVNPPHDIRVLANMTDGLNSCVTLLHELGHAMHAGYVEQPTFVLRDAPSDAFSESIAQLFAGLASDYSWLSDIIMLDEDKAMSVVGWGAHQRLSRMRWLLVWARLEQALFQEPGINPTERFWSLAAKIVGVFPPENANDIPAWAQVVHFVSHPLYLQNYILADIMAAQHMSRITSTNGDLWKNRDQWVWVRDELLAPGATKTWTTLIGGSIDTKPYLESLNGSEKPEPWYGTAQ